MLVFAIRTFYHVDTEFFSFSDELNDTVPGGCPLQNSRGFGHVRRSTPAGQT